MKIYPTCDCSVHQVADGRTFFVRIAKFRNAKSFSTVEKVTLGLRVDGFAVVVLRTFGLDIIFEENFLKFNKNIVKSNATRVSRI
jgi:hypothetical protein